MITMTGEYALRAVVCLAGHPGESLTAETISQIADIPVGYLSKIMQGLTRAGLVTSQRGPRGGFSLRKEAAHITVYDVVKAADQLPREHAPVISEILPATSKILQRLHHLLSKAREQLEHAYRETSIAALIDTSHHDETRPPTNDALHGQ